MSKADVKQAISETMVSNGKRAITAPSMANLLNMMVDEAGGGGGVLVLRLGSVVGDMPILSTEDKEHNMQIFQALKEAVLKKEQSVPALAIDYGELIKQVIPELATDIEELSLIFVAPTTGYIRSAALQVEIGYGEFAFLSDLTNNSSGAMLLLPDGSIIVDA